MKILKRKQLKEENLNLINGINYSLSIKNNANNSRILKFYNKSRKC